MIHLELPFDYGNDSKLQWLLKDLIDLTMGDI